MSLTQKIAGLTWDLCEPPVTEQVIAEHERVLSVAFPPDFRRVIQMCPGGHPIERDEFWMEHPAHGRMGSSLGGLVTMAPPDDAEGMLWSAHALHHGHQLSQQIIPFAVDGGGDYMCLDYRDSETAPSVVYYSHEAPIEQSLCYLTDSFSAFLALLEEPEEGPDVID